MFVLPVGELCIRKERFFGVVYGNGSSKPYFGFVLIKAIVEWQNRAM